MSAHRSLGFRLITQRRQRVSVNHAPNTPTISAGTPTSSGATLTISAFSDPDVGDTHAATQWRITRVSDSVVVYNPGDDTVNKTSLVWSGGAASTAYTAEARTKDSAGNYSLWGSDAFTTSAAMNDVQTLVAALGGDSKVLAFYDTNYNVTNDGAGHVTAWDDARGAAGYGPQVVGMGATKPAWDSVNKIISTSGSNWLQNATPSATFKLTDDRTLILIAALNSTANFPAGLTSDPYTGSTYWTVGGTPTQGTSGFGGAPSSKVSPDGTTFRLIMASRVVTDASDERVQVWGKAVNPLVTGASADSTHDRVFTFGGLPNSGALTLGAASKIKSAIVVDHKLSPAEVDALLTYANGRYTAATQVKTMFCDGNSLTAGTGVTASTDAWPVKFAAKPNAVGYDVLNYGVPSRTGTTILSVLPKRILNQYDAARGKNVYVYWEGINDIGTRWSTIGDAGVQANVHDACLAAKQRGFVTVVCTCIKWTTDSWATQRGAYNTYVRGAVAGGWADVMVDLDADAAFSDPTNTTYYNADQTHLTIAGYQKVADLIYAAVSALL